MAESWLHEAICRQRYEMWPIFGSSISTVIEIKICSFKEFMKKGRTAIYRCTAQQAVPL